MMIIKAYYFPPLNQKIFHFHKLTETSKLIEEELEQLTKDLSIKNEKLFNENEKIKEDFQNYKVIFFS